MKPKICGVLTDNNPLEAKNIAPLVDLYEVRIDLIGDSWRKLVRDLGKPWIACNRTIAEGGTWSGAEFERLDKLVQAIDLGASMVDIELSTRQIERFISRVNSRAACIVSSHNYKNTPEINDLKALINRQLAKGADICKVVTTANEFKDNLTVLRLISEFPDVKIVSFAMGTTGILSRVVSPMVGAEFTYASIEQGKESAPGQATVTELRNIYVMVTDEANISRN